MIIIYRATDRKALVRAVSELMGAEAIYLRTPTYAYQIGDFTVTREGNLSFEVQMDEEKIRQLKKHLAEKGFAEEKPTDRETAEDKRGRQESTMAEGIEEHETFPQEENVGFTVALPRAAFTDTALENLTKLVEAKGSLIKKALAVEELPIELDEEKLSFPWFPDVSDGERVKAYTHLVTALCDMARSQKRISATEKQTENEKYAFRCFLLRLGFIGGEYKEERKILLQNLSGSSAFKSGEKKEVEDHAISE